MGYDIIKLTNTDLDYFFKTITETSERISKADVLRHLPFPHIAIELKITNREYDHVEYYDYDEITSTLTITHEGKIVSQEDKFSFRVRLVPLDNQIGFKDFEIIGQHPDWVESFLLSTVEYSPSDKEPARKSKAYTGYIGRFINLNTYVSIMEPEKILSSTTRKVEVSHKSKKKKRVSKPNKVKLYKVYTLKPDYKIASEERKHFIMTCPAWGVRGHYRHYKDGKTVWVKAYVKGRERDKYKEKEYVVLNNML